MGHQGHALRDQEHYAAADDPRRDGEADARRAREARDDRRGGGQGAGDPARRGGAGDGHPQGRRGDRREGRARVRQHAARPAVFDAVRQPREGEQHDDHSVESGGRRGRPQGLHERREEN